MTIVEVDFNNIDAAGHVRALPSALTAELQPGDRVTAVDRLEDMEFEGTVVEQLSDGGVALAIEWETADPSAVAVSPFFVNAPSSYSYAANPVFTVHGAIVNAASATPRTLATAG